MRGITGVSLLVFAMSLGGCNFKTEGNVFSTATGDQMPLSGKLECQVYGDNGKPEGSPQPAYLISLKNGPNQQYLWITDDWLKKPKEIVSATMHHVLGDRFLFVSQEAAEPGQSVYSLRATATRFEIRYYDKERVEAVAKNFRVQVTAGDYHSYSMKGDQEAQSAFLRELNRTSEGAHLIFGCSSAEKVPAPEDQ